MKKYLIIIGLLISVFGFGQDGQWDSTEAIIYDSYSTGKIVLGASDTMYLIKVDSIDVVNAINYINCQSDVAIVYDLDGDATVDTMQAVNAFQVYNFDDLLYFRKNPFTIDTDSTMLLPERITEIERYSIPTDRYTYFNVPFSETASMKVLDASGGGDYTDLHTFLTALSTGDTGLVKHGEYDDINNPFVNKNGVYICAVGDNRITSDYTTYTFYVTGNNNKFENLLIDGEGNTSVGYYANNDDNVTMKNCYITNTTLSPIRMYGGVGAFSHFYLYNNVIVNTSVSAASAEIRYGHHYIVGNRFIDGNGITINYNNNANDTSSYSHIYYNKSLRDNDNVLFAALYRNQIVDFKFNYLEAELCRMLAYVDDNANYRELNINYNHFESDSALNNNGFINIGDTLKYFRCNVWNNYIKINTTTIESVAITLSSACSMDVNNNTILMGSGTSGIWFSSINNDSVTLTANNNKIYVYRCLGPGLGNCIGLNYDDFFHPDHNLIIHGNDFKMPKVWDINANSGHGVIYFYNVKKADVAYNSIKGGQTSGIHIKASTGTTNGLDGSEIYIYGNLFDTNNILIKGVRGVNVINNTVNSIHDDAIRIFTNEDAAPDEDAAYCKVYNNIFQQYDSVNIYPIFIGKPADTVGLEFDYNIVYGRDSISFNAVKYTFSGWHGLGYDANSFNTSPNLNANLVPNTGSPAIGNGVNLGVTYNTGLYPNTSFPNPTTRTQFANWSIGAYVPNLNTTVTNVKIVRYKGFFIKY